MRWDETLKAAHRRSGTILPDDWYNGQTVGETPEAPQKPPVDLPAETPENSGENSDETAQDSDGNTAAITDETPRHIQASALRRAGWSLRRIAAELDCGVETVRRDLTKADTRNT